MEIEKGIEIIEDHVYLRKLTPEEEQIFELKPRTHPSYYLVIDIKDFDENGYDLMNHFLLSLQLNSNTMVFIEAMFWGTHDFSHKANPLIDIPNIPFATALGPEDIKNSKELLTDIMKINFDSNHSMRIACDRFSRIKTNRNVEDQLIDACIAYEALFLKGERSSSNRDLTIALACSMLIGTSQKERDKIKQVVGDGFKLRNSIVHGSSSDAEKLLKTNIPFCEYLRRSLVEIITTT